MPKNKKKLLAAFVAAALLCFLAGCGQKSGLVSLYDNETKAYTHSQIGASMTVPAAWHILAETEDSVVFTTPDTDMTLTLAWELGGYTYYSDADLLDMGAAVAGQVLAEPEILRQQARTLPGNNELVTAAGPLLGDENGANAVCEVMIFSPIAAVRYYVITVAEVEAYEANSRLLGEVYASFYLSQTEDEIYAGLSQSQPEEEEPEAENAPEENAPEIEPEAEPQTDGPELEPGN